MLEEVGKALRAIRKDKGLRIADLAEKGLSSATISFIEQGKKVKPKKVDRYCEKLGVQPNDFPALIHKQTQSNDQLIMDLFLIESKIQLGLHDGSLISALREIEKHGEDLLDLVNFLKGEYYFKRQNLGKARSCFEKALHLSNKKQDPSSNLISAIYKELARLSFYEENDLKTALHYTRLGLASYNPKGDRSDIKYFLIIGQVVYLEKLNRIDEALLKLDELWDDLPHIDNIEIRLNMYDIKASLLNRKKAFDDALHYAMEGYRIASSNEKHRRAVELLTTWGTILTNLKDYEGAKDRYLQALEFREKKKVQGYNLFVSTYTYLGLLYKELEDITNARSYLEEAVRLGKKSKDTPRYCFALMSLAELEASQQSLTNAVLFYEKAKSLAQKFHLDNQLQTILSHLADCWKKAGNQEKYITSLEEIQKLLLNGGEENLL